MSELSNSGKPSKRNSQKADLEGVSKDPKRLLRDSGLEMVESSHAGNCPNGSLNGKMIPSNFTIEELVQHPPPGFVTPTNIQFSPDDSIVSYLHSPEGTLNRKLFCFDPETGEHSLLVSPPGGGVDEANISNAEKLRRERTRERGLGVTRYEWSRHGNEPRILVPLPDGMYAQNGRKGHLELLVSATSSSPIQDPQISPDGAAVAYVREDELWTVSTTIGSPPTQLTFGAKAANKTHGLAEYIAQEEMERRYGFWWSNDSQFIAFTEVDSSAVPLYRIVHQGKPGTGEDAQEDHAYPFAGKPNAKVRLGVVSARSAGRYSKQVTWMDLHCGTDPEEEYLARVHWLSERQLMVEVLNRAQTRLRLLRYDARTGRRTVVLEEHNPHWVNLHRCFSALRQGSGFLWASERTGFQHLYLYSPEGSCLGPLTRGPWMVDHLVGVDEQEQQVYFLGSADSPLETHLYCASLNPSPQCPEPRRLTQGRGKHVVLIDHKMKRFVDIFDSLDSPPSLSLRSLQTGELIAVVFQQAVPNPRVQRLGLRAPEIVTVPSREGMLLYGAIYRPDEAVHGPPPYRTVVSVYGGPHLQIVTQSWMAMVDMRAQFLCSRGFLVWKLDNRGSSGRGVAFESAMKKKMGTVDVEDQETGVQWLVKQGLADPTRIGIYGWSYGGYMAAMCLAKLPHIFKCAVSGAPVTSWDGYDTHYTERYMGHPEEEPRAYEESSVMRHVGGMRGKLLLVHGMIDENVHFRHTARLINALTSARKEYELLLFPDERHMPRGLPDRVYMEERIFEFLNRNLK